MRILIYGLNFAPELVGIGKYTGEMADWLTRHGHEVRVVTTPPFNPAWKVREDYSGWRYRTERSSGIGETGSLTVFRCPVWVPRQPKAFTRILHLASFAFSSVPVMLSQILWRPSLVFVVEPAAFCLPLALMTARLSGARSWLHIQDFEVDAGFAVGMLKSAMLRTFIAGIEKKLMSWFDRTSTISQKMLDRLGDKGVPSIRRVLFPNWVDTKCIFPTGNPSRLRNTLGIPQDAVIALYSGTMGRKQGLEILADACNLLFEKKNIHFVFCGEGPGREVLESRTKQFPNVRWLPLQPIEHLNDLMNLADIHLLPQCAEAADLVMPSKLTGMLASGRPVVATAEAGTQLADVVRDRGLVVHPNDATRFGQVIAQLAEDKIFRNTLARNARKYAEQALDRERVLAHFEQDFLQLFAPDQVSAIEVQGKSGVSHDPAAFISE